MFKPTGVIAVISKFDLMFLSVRNVRTLVISFRCSQNNFEFIIYLIGFLVVRISTNFEFMPIDRISI